MDSYFVQIMNKSIQLKDRNGLNSNLNSVRKIHAFNYKPKV